MSAPVKIDYPGTLRRMIKLVGMNTERESATKAIAKDLGVNEGAIAYLRTVAARTGGLEVRYTQRLKADKRPDGRVAWWTFVHDAEWIIAKAKQMWGVDLAVHGTLSKMPRDQRYNQKRRKTAVQETRLDPKGTPVEMRQTRVTRPEPGQPPTEKHHWMPLPEGGHGWVDTAVGEEPETTQIAAALRPALRYEEEAMIEAARQYRDRAKFVDDELARFAQMGIEIDRSAIKLHPDERLEAVATVLDYVDKIRAANDRMAARMQSDGPRVQSQIESALRVQNEQLRSERSATAQATETLVASYRLRIQSLERQLREAGHTPVKMKESLTQPAV